MKIPPVITNIAARPENYFFGEHYYDCFVAFLAGYDAACDNQLMAGFREWLILTQNIDASEVSGLGWERLLLRIESPKISSNTSIWPRTPAEHVIAIRNAVKRIVDFCSSLPLSSEK